jgi:hypothetical protein
MTQPKARVMLTTTPNHESYRQSPAPSYRGVMLTTTPNQELYRQSPAPSYRGVMLTTTPNQEFYTYIFKHLGGVVVNMTPL